MAPELHLGRTHSTPSIDVWSLGIILYALILGEYPFSDPDREVLKKHILKKEICVSKQHQGIASAEVLDLIDKMLVKEPGQRLALIDVLHHPWFMTDSKFISKVAEIFDAPDYESPLKLKPARSHIVSSHNVI